MFKPETVGMIEFIKINENIKINKYFYYSCYNKQKIVKRYGEKFYDSFYCKSDMYLMEQIIPIRNSFLKYQTDISCSLQYNNGYILTSAINGLDI